MITTALLGVDGDVQVQGIDERAFQFIGPASASRETAGLVGGTLGILTHASQVVGGFHTFITSSRNLWVVDVQTVVAEVFLTDLLGARDWGVLVWYGYHQ